MAISDFPQNHALVSDVLRSKAEKMRERLQNLSGGLVFTSPEPNFPAASGGRRSGYLWWLWDCHGLLFNLSLVVPSMIFVAYLASRGKKSFTKLKYGRSHVMTAYYVLLCVVSVLNLLWCFLQAMQCNPAKQSSWIMLSLFTNSGMLFMEISLVAFLLQGNHATGSKALIHTFVVSGIIVAGDMVLKAIYAFNFGVPLFIDEHETGNRAKWGLWIVHKLFLGAVYGFILFIHHSKWRDRLPERPAFYNYTYAMFLFNVVSLSAYVLVENGAGFGFWLFDLAAMCYHSLYLPFLYVTFLADFFQEDDMRLESAYYSEMKDAGFFDDEWD